MTNDFEFDVPSVEEEEGRSPNRAFITAVAGIGGVLILSLICLGLYTLVIAPRQREAAEQRPTEIALTNTEIARLLTATALAEQGIDEATPTPTSQAATATNTPAVSPTATEVVVLTTSTPTTVGPQTATAQAQATLNAAAQQAATATSTPTALPGTGGFAEDIGIPGMLLLAAVLVTIIFVARHLRTRST
jgi:cytoskeletal protein RodZ